MPFAPATNAGSGHLLFAATSGFGKNLMGGLHDFFKTREESKGFDTLIENTAKMNASDPKFLETFGDQLSKAPGMSLSQKRNLAGSLALYEQKGRQQQEMALKRADDVRADQFLKLQQDQFNAGQQQREAQGRMSELLARYSAAPASLGEQFATGTAGMDQPAGLTLDRYLAAAGEAKAQPDPRVLEQFIQNGQRQGRPEWGGPEIRVMRDPRTGREYSAALTGPNQAELIKDAPEVSPNTTATLNFREKAMRYNALNSRLKALETQLGINPAVVQPQIDQIRAEMQAIANGADPAAPAGKAPTSSFEAELNDLLNRRR